MNLLIISASLLWSLFGVDWDSIDARIDREFPGVAFISTDNVRAVIGDSGQPLIIDVREPREFRVSHLPQAMNLESGAAIAQRYPDRATPIVVYCSVGYRSARVATELEALGYSDVQNLRHSIFEWANKDYPLVNAAGDTDRVHPFNSIWGSLVDDELRAYRP